MENELKQRVIEKLQKGEELPAEWARFLFPPEKREYELVYHGKERVEDVLTNTLVIPPQPIRTFGKNGNNHWNNMLIFGDNLQVMKYLSGMKKSARLCNTDGTPGVRLVYIDPPFATRQDFRGTDDQKAYQDKIAGAQFIEFIRKRLIFIRELLCENGSVFVHLDYKKSHYIKCICDEVFGESNFRSEIIWKRTDAHNDTKGIGKIHDMILHYSKTSEMIWNPIFTPLSAKTADKWYRHIDEATGRRYNKADLTARGTRRGETGKSWRGINPTDKGNHWRYQPSKLTELDKQGLIVFSKSGMPYLKRYLDDSKGTTLQDMWTDIAMIRGFGNQSVSYPTQKPEALLERIIHSASNKGDLILDAFAGSGTTCAVAEKLGRRWVGIDCGKLAIYTIQKRLLGLSTEIGTGGPKLECKPFTLYNAGLYDFSKLKELPWDSWRFFALQLFQCRDDQHKIGGVRFDGYLKGSSVLVFDHTKNPGARFTEETLEEIHEAVGSRIGSKLFIIAPALTFGFQQDYIDLDGVRYYALRIPYSIINELHQHEFTALKQPAHEMAVNETVEAVGFDFIRTPELKFKCSVGTRKGEMFNDGIIKIQTFKSEAVVREPFRKKENLETLSMVMLDYNYDGEVFDLDAVFYADALAKTDWAVRFPLESLGAKIMAVFIDIYGNEARILLEASEFGIKTGKKARKAVAK